MDLEVYMSEHYDHRGLVAEAKASCHGMELVLGIGRSYPVIREDYQSMTEALCRLRPVNLAMELVGIAIPPEMT